MVYCGDLNVAHEEIDLKNPKTNHFNPVKAIQKVEEIGAPYGIGRDMHVGDTIIGIKGRVGFEACLLYTSFPHTLLLA